MDAKNRFIILKKVRYSEADLIIQALSPEGGKMSFIARGALKSRRRFGGGVLEPGNFVQLTYHVGGGQLATLKEAAVINDFHGLRKDYDRLEFALRAIEAVGKVSQEGDTMSAFLFNLLGNSLKALEAAPDLRPVKLQFWLKLLFQQGVLTAEPWMTPFLKASLSDYESLTGEAKQEERRIPGLEMLVEQYVKNAHLV